MLKVILQLLAIASIAAIAHGKPTISDSLYAALRRDGTARAIFSFPPLLKNGAALAGEISRPDRFVLVTALKRHARASQYDTVRALKEAGVQEYTQYWIDNSLHVRLNSTLLTVLTRDGVEAAVTADTSIATLNLVDTKILAEGEPNTRHLKQLKMEAAWRHFNNTRPITVATIDTGVQYDHPELQASYTGLWLDMQSVPRDLRSTTPHDPHGHGTHTMASLVGRRVGTAPNTRWMTARACDDHGCLRSDLTAAAEFVLCPDRQCRRGADVVSNSYGATDPRSMQWFDSIVAAWRAAGMAIVFAAGNSGPDCNTLYSPASNPLVLAVGAVNEHSQVCTFSSRAATAGNMVVAPGLKIVSAWPGNRYAEMSGTSMACPLVAGIVSLLAASGVGGVDVIKMVKETADRSVVVGDECCEDGGCAYGHGLVDAYRALRQAGPGME